MYLIITYLTFFRLDELGFNEYRKFIESQEPDKMTGEHPMGRHGSTNTIPTAPPACSTSHRRSHRHHSDSWAWSHATTFATTTTTTTTTAHELHHSLGA